MTESTARLAVLFADICDSVRLYEREGDARAHQMAAQCLRLMVESTERFGGTLIRTQGDGVMSTFSTADAAFDAAKDMQGAHRCAPVTIKVAFTYGTLIKVPGDVYGDNVNLASRVMGLARSGEILMTEATAHALSPDRRAQTRLLDIAPVKGKAKPVNIYTITGASGDRAGEPTTVFAEPLAANPAALRGTLVLGHAGREWRVSETPRPLVIGRADDCDLIVRSDLASRRHALLEAKRSYFVLTDQSTNGTFVVNQETELVFLKRESIQLLGSGAISLGREPQAAPELAIRFRHIFPEAAGR
jgi:adenylate cyclase